MMTIKVGQNHAIIDDEDFDILNQYHWYFDHGYARTDIYNKGQRKRLYMHVLLNGRYTDHQNGNKLDNRRCNLRRATQQQNIANRAGYSASGFKGVYSHGVRWVAKIFYNGQRIHIGVFDNKVDAAKAYNLMAKKYFGEYAGLNDV